MDEITLDALGTVAQGLKSLADVINHSISFGMAEGTGDMMIKQYRGLHYRALQILNDDTYVKEFLTLEPINRATDNQKIVQVQLLAEQLLLYVRGLIRAEKMRATAAERDAIVGNSEAVSEEMRNLTQEMLRRAMSKIDPDEDAPPRKPGK